VNQPEEEDPGAMDRALTISAIEFDWIFEKQGLEFITQLAESQELELFNVKIVRTILSFFWTYYQRKIIYWYMIPMMILFTLFCLDSTLFHYKKLDSPKWNDWYIVSFITMILNALLLTYFWIYEIL
jgi:hypothetical protein